MSFRWLLDVTAEQTAHNHSPQVYIISNFIGSFLLLSLSPSIREKSSDDVQSWDKLGQSFTNLEQRSCEQVSCKNLWRKISSLLEKIKFLES